MFDEFKEYPEPGTVYRHNKTGELLRVVDYNPIDDSIVLERPGGGKTRLPLPTLNTLYEPTETPRETAAFADLDAGRATPDILTPEPALPAPVLDSKFVHRGRFFTSSNRGRGKHLPGTTGGPRRRGRPRKDATAEILTQLGK